jgi:anaerobic glycerol-3-phosphate dehydrogenase
MQPCDSDGRPFFANVFACGGLLGGADRRTEGSREGIDLVTAYAAVEAALS